MFTVKTERDTVEVYLGYFLNSGLVMLYGKFMLVVWDEVICEPEI